MILKRFFPQDRQATATQALTLLACILVVLFSGRLEARSIPAVNRPLCDEAGTLDLKTKETVRQICFDLQQETKAEINVLIIRTTSGENHHLFTLKTFNTWGIGLPRVDNGMLIMFALDDRRVEIVPGSRYLPFFDETTCTTLLTSLVVPKMKAGQTGEGVIAATREVASRIRNLEKQGKAGPKPGMGKTPSNSLKAEARGKAGQMQNPGATPTNVGKTETGGIASHPFLSKAPMARALVAWGSAWFQRYGPYLFIALLLAWMALGGTFIFTAFTSGRLLAPIWVMGLIMFLGAIILAFLGVSQMEHDLVVKGNGGGLISFLVFYFLGRRICPKCNKYMSVWDRTIRSATYSSTGLGETTQDCSNCGYHRVSTYTISRKTKSSHSHSSSGGSSSRGRSSGGGGGASW